MLNIEVTPAMGIAYELIKSGKWNEPTNVLPLGYAETAILWQYNPDKTLRLQMPDEIPCIKICINGRQGGVMYPEVALTAKLHPKYDIKEPKEPKPAPKPQPKKQRKADTPYWIARNAEANRQSARYEADSTLPRSRHRSRADARTVALKETASARERMFAIRLDEEHLNKRLRDEAADEAEEYQPCAKKSKSKNRGLDNREAKTKAAPATENPTGMNMGRSQIYFIILALTLIYLLSRVNTPAQEY